jgi:hypothetical protein
MIARAWRSRVSSSMGSSESISFHSEKDTGSSHAGLPPPVFVDISEDAKALFSEVPV